MKNLKMSYPKKLSSQEIEFLIHHKIKPNQLYDVKKKNKTEYYQIMKSIDKYYAFGCSPCLNGHTLRTRNGHCVICNPARIAFQNRASKAGYVYAMGSMKAKLIKIGFTNNYKTRETSVNKQRYGSYNDWKLLIVLSSSEAGKLELKMQSMLSKYHTTRKYFHDNHFQEGTELYHCSKKKIVQSYKRLQHGWNYTVVYNLDSNQYNFRNLVKV